MVHNDPTTLIDPSGLMAVIPRPLDTGDSLWLTVTTGSINVGTSTPGSWHTVHGVDISGEHFLDQLGGGSWTYGGSAPPAGPFDWLKGGSNFFGGFSDQILPGSPFANGLGTANPESGMYKGGQLLGIGWQMAMAWAKAAAAAAEAAQSGCGMDPSCFVAGTAVLVPGDELTVFATVSAESGLLSDEGVPSLAFWPLLVVLVGICGYGATRLKPARDEEEGACKGDRAKRTWRRRS